MLRGVLRYHHLMEVSDVRRRLRTAIDEARRRAEVRRGQRDEASRAWERLLPEVAVPAFQMMASALTGEGLRFNVMTPGTAVRLTPERGGEEFIELALVTDREEPALLLTSTRGRGRRIISTERVLCEGSLLATVTEDDVIAGLLEALLPFVER
jgi:hypothetical protein